MLKWVFLDHNERVLSTSLVMMLHFREVRMLIICGVSVHYVDISIPKSDYILHVLLSEQRTLRTQVAVQ